MYNCKNLLLPATRDVGNTVVLGHGFKLLVELLTASDLKWRSYFDALTMALLGHFLRLLLNLDCYAAKCSIQCASVQLRISSVSLFSCRHPRQRLLQLWAHPLWPQREPLFFLRVSFCRFRNNTIQFERNATFRWRTLQL